MNAYENGPDPDRMDRDERRELLNAYMDGELSAEDALRVSAWLDAHPDALREVEQLRHLWDLLELYEDEPVPEDFAAGVMDAVGIAPPERRAGKVVPMAWYRRPLATAAAVLVAVGATVFVMSNLDRAPTRVDRPPVQTVDLDAVDAEYLEHLDLLVELDDETFEAFLEGEEIADATEGS
jgi:anti-sigma factor RsiW